VEDGFADCTLILDHKFRMGEGSDYWWKTTGLTYNSIYNHENTLNINSFLILTGPGIETTDYAAEVRALVAYVAKGYVTNVTSVGVSADGVVTLNRWAALLAAAKFEDRQFTAPGKDAFNWAATIGPILAWGQNKVTVTAMPEYNKAITPQQTYVGLTTLARFERRLPYDVVAFGYYQYQNFQYHGTDPTFLNRRKDNVHEVSAGLSKKVWQNLSVEAIYTYTKSNSSNPLYDYSRQLFSGALSWEF
jgi:hypothetical protein